MPRHCKAYGLSAGIATICAMISCYLLQNNCKFTLQIASLNNLPGDFSQNHLETIHYIAIIVGAILFTLSFFDFVGILHEVSLVFGFASGAMMLYATYLSFYLTCKSGFSMSNLIDNKNVIEAGDGIGMLVFALDAICALTLVSAALSIARSFQGFTSRLFR